MIYRYPICYSFEPKSSNDNDSSFQKTEYHLAFENFITSINTVFDTSYQFICSKIEDPPSDEIDIALKELRHITTEWIKEQNLTIEITPMLYDYLNEIENTWKQYEHPIEQMEIDDSVSEFERTIQTILNHLMVVCHRVLQTKLSDIQKLFDSYEKTFGKQLTFDNTLTNTPIHITDTLDATDDLIMNLDEKIQLEPITNTKQNTYLTEVIDTMFNALRLLIRSYTKTQLNQLNTKKNPIESQPKDLQEYSDDDSEVSTNNEEKEHLINKKMFITKVTKLLVNNQIANIDNMLTQADIIFDEIENDESSPINFLDLEQDIIMGINANYFDRNTGCQGVRTNSGQIYRGSGSPADFAFHRQFAGVMKRIRCVRRSNHQRLQQDLNNPDSEHFFFAQMIEKAENEWDKSANRHKSTNKRIYRCSAYYDIHEPNKLTSPKYATYKRELLIRHSCAEFYMG